jgi:hypothetical protein
MNALSEELGITRNAALVMILRPSVADQVPQDLAIAEHYLNVEHIVDNLPAIEEMDDELFLKFFRFVHPDLQVDHFLREAGIIAYLRSIDDLVDVIPPDDLDNPYLPGGLTNLLEYFRDDIDTGVIPELARRFFEDEFEDTGELVYNVYKDVIPEKVARVATKDLDLFLYHVIHNKYNEWEWLDPDKLEKMNDNLLYEWYFEEWIEAGYDLFKMFLEGTTKNEKIKFFREQYDRDFHHNPYNLGIMTPHLLEVRYPGLWNEIEDYDHIPKTWIQADWVHRHLNWLKKTHVVHMHGQAMEQSNMLYIRDLRDEFLVNGAKTSPKKVVKSIKDFKREEARRSPEFPLSSLDPLPDGFDDIRFIETNKELIKEGDKMNHCAADYVKDARYGESFIFHIGEQAPKGATFEVRPRNGQFEVAQVYAYGDKAPLPDHEEEVDRFVAELNRIEPEIVYTSKLWF